MKTRLTMIAIAMLLGLGAAGVIAQALGATDVDEPDTATTRPASPGGHIVYVIDYSGSMHDCYPFATNKVAESVAEMQDSQRVQIMLFGHTLIESIGFKAASNDVKAEHLSFLNENKNPFGRLNTAMPQAITKAFAQLKSVRDKQDKTICIVTDGSIRVGNGEDDLTEIKKLVSRLNANKSVKVDVVMIAPRETPQHAQLRILAVANGGKFIEWKQQ